MPSQGHFPHQASFGQTRNTPINLTEPSPSQGFRETTQIGEAKTLALHCFLSSYSCWNTLSACYTQGLCKPAVQGLGLISKDTVL